MSNPNKISDARLAEIISSYQCFTKNEHSIDSRDKMNLLIELQQLRLLLADAGMWERCARYWYARRPDNRDGAAIDAAMEGVSRE